MGRQDDVEDKPQVLQGVSGVLPECSPYLKPTFSIPFSQAESLLSNCYAGTGKYYRGDTAGSDVCVRDCNPEVNGDTTCGGLVEESMKTLPQLTDRTKLNAMKFLGMLCVYSNTSAQMLLPLICCRMLRITVEHGFTDDAVLGLMMTGYSLYLFTDSVDEAYRIGKLGEYLRDESKNKNRLKALLCQEWEGGLKILKEPAQAVVSLYPALCESAMLVGDVQCARMCNWAYAVSNFYVGTNLIEVTHQFAQCLHQATIYQQNGLLHLTMVLHGTLTTLSGEECNDDIKTFEELSQIGQESQNPLLLFHISMGKVHEAFWFRDYASVVKLCETGSSYKRMLLILRSFYFGIAALNLARQTGEGKWISVGEEATDNMSRLASFNRWNWGNKAELLKAELLYSNGQILLAEEQYKLSIVSAHKHQFLNDEALSYELYGMFLLDNGRVDEGAQQLNFATDKYRAWGSHRKVEIIQQFIHSTTHLGS